MALQLVKLPEVEKASSLVIRILAGNPGKFTLQGTNTYLIGKGSQRLLIDTGEGRPAWAKSLESVLAQENATVTSALITHWHHDHVNGIQDLKRLCPGVRIYKHDPEDGQFALEDKDVFQVDGTTLEAMYTPDKVLIVFSQVRVTQTN
ncbi:hypothetical protein KEM56_001612 [Ascosphaera pollenicola]|nr:hypothetical protein KEM56_001612 [Ascosphaera pollenicola]